VPIAVRAPSRITMSVMLDVSPLMSVATLLRARRRRNPADRQEARTAGASQSIAGPIGTIPVGLIVRWLW